MEIRKRIGFITFLAIAVQTLFAQQEYQSGDYGSPGTLYLYNRLPLTSFPTNINEDGESISWDVTSFSDFNSHPSSIVTSSSVIDFFTFLFLCGLGGNEQCAATWSSTDQALLLQDTVSLLGLNLANIQRFQNKTTNYLLENFLGFNVNFGGTPTQAVVVYNSPDTILHFPVTYGDAWESNIDWMIDLNGVGQNFRFVSNQERVSSVDAWGTIYTPFDTFTNVIRVRSEIRHTDTIAMDSNVLPVNLIQLEYSWYDTAFKLPVMIATGILVDTLEVISTVEYLFERTCAEPTWSVELDTTVFALDPNGEVTIDFNIINGNADSYEWNFDDAIIETTTGSVSHTYYDDRDYVITITGCMENCLPLNSCTTEILEFTIEDISAVDVVNGNALGITIYPNPVRDFIKVGIPEYLGSQYFQITDMTGRIVQAGQLPSGTSIVDLKSKTSGLYTISLRGKDTKQHAFLRFIIK